MTSFKALCFYLIISIFYNFGTLTAQVTATADFEFIQDGEKNFSASGVSFEIEEELQGIQLLGAGAGGSAGFLDHTGLLTGTIAEISILNTGFSFKVNSLKGFTTTDINNYSAGSANITFVGHSVNGGTLTETFFVDGINNGDAQGFATVVFVGALANAQITRLDIQIPGTTGRYFAMDDFSFTTATFNSNDWTIDDTSLSEGVSGTSDMMFTVTRTNTTDPATINFSTSDITTTAGVDYTSVTNQTLSFVTGEATKMAVVSINGDTDIEPDEKLVVTLSNPSNGTILDGTAEGTILNDDSGFETFEDEEFSGSNKMFSEPAATFTVAASDPFEVDKLTGLGAGGSDWMLETSGNVSGLAGTISIQNTSTSFTMQNVACWTTIPNGSNPVSGPVTFTGVPYGGGADVVYSTTCNPNGNAFEVLGFAGTPLDGLELSDLKVEIGSTLGYIALDNFDYRVTVDACPDATIIGDNEICIGETTTLSPSTGGTWASSDDNVATVTNGGMVTGIGAGTATFTFAESGTGCVETTSAVTVNATPIVSISGAVQICIGATTSLSPSSGGTWVSSDDNVATVTNGGSVTGIGAGSATFTFTDATTDCTATTDAVEVTANCECFSGNNMFTGTDGDWSKASNWSLNCIPTSPYIGNLAIMNDINTSSLGPFELTGNLIIESGATFEHANGNDFDVLGSISVLVGGNVSNTSTLTTTLGMTNAGTYSGKGIDGNFINNGVINIGGN